MEKYGNCRSQFLHTHMFMYTKHVPESLCGFVVIFVVVPDGSAGGRIVHFLSV